MGNVTVELQLFRFPIWEACVLKYITKKFFFKAISSVSAECSDQDEVVRIHDLESGNSEVDMNNTKPSSYIHTHFNIMYLFCTTTYKTNQTTENEQNKSGTILGVVASKLHTVIQSKLIKCFYVNLVKDNVKWYGTQALFWLVLLLSSFQSFFDAKFAFLWFSFEGGFRQLVRFFFHIACLATSLCGAYILWRKHETFRKMIKIIKSFETRREFKTIKPWLPIGLGIMTVILAILRSVVSIEIEKLSVENITLVSSLLISEDLFIWSPQNLNITSHQLDDQFGAQVNLNAVLLAAVKIIRDFSYHIQSGMIWDLLLNVVFAMHCWMTCFMTLVNDVKDNISDENLEKQSEHLQRKRELTWEIYRELKSVFKAVNDLFDPLLILFHLTNVLRYAIFLERCVYLINSPAMIYIQIVYDIVRSEVIYVAASRVAQQVKFSFIFSFIKVLRQMFLCHY